MFIVHEVGTQAAKHGVLNSQTDWYKVIEMTNVNRLMP